MFKRIAQALCFGLVLAQGLALAAEPPKDEQTKDDKTQDESTGRYMELGTKSGVLGGEEQQRFERSQIKTQILTFIPPLLRPAFTEHAYILPPNAFSVGVAHRFTTLHGDDFFMNGSPNRAVFDDAKVQRHLTDFDFFYGFDLNRKYLHGFTLRVNVPYLDSRMDGSIHPNGQQFIAIENAGSTQGIGDVGVFLKKKFLDQGTFPFGLAGAAAVFFPTGDNDDKFGSKGRVTTRRPQPPDTISAQGFDAVMKAMVESGVWGAPQCFFRNFNLMNRQLCDGPADGPGGPFGAPADAVESFAPGGANADNQFVGDFPFNDGVFAGFADDGRMPSVLQPGTGAFGGLLAGFLTRQFSPNTFLVGRSAVHAGVAHQFVQKKDGVDFGDTTTYFTSFVKPVYKDFMAVDLTFVGFDHEHDSYSGKLANPVIRNCTAEDVDSGTGGCSASGDRTFVFDVVDRPKFSAGFTGFVAPSLIFSPDPQIRLTVSGLIRVIEPDLGPAPPWVVRAGIDVIF